MFNAYKDELELVFENGEIKRHQTFDEIREITNEYFNLEMKEDEKVVA